METDKSNTCPSNSCPVQRVHGITRHLTDAAPAVSVAEWASTTDNLDTIMAMIENLPSNLKDLEYDIAEHLPGPMRDTVKYPNGWADVFFDFRKRFEVTGEPHLGIAEMQKEYGGEKGLSSNIVLPHLVMGRKGPNNSGRTAVPRLDQQVIIGDPEDAMRTARMHVKKNPLYSYAFYNSVISTTDHDEWKQQREHLVGSLLPIGALKEIFPVTLQRAKKCATRLGEVAADADKPEGAGVVNMNDFLLYETEAQLQLALFGMDNDFMEETNEKFRRAMSGAIEPLYARQFCKALMLKMNEDPDISGPVSAGLAASCPVKGPLSDALKTLDMEGKARVGNAFIFAFAGHDTTGHTLTWLLYELARAPHLQARLQKEVDEFFDSLGGRDMTYNDLAQLPFMTRCIMETLRLWPAVANGTFREIQFDDTINGKDNEDVVIKKGTLVQIVNWSRHRNPDLWGEDVNTFNPDRDFRGEEIWNGDVIRAYNPQSERFSPFTFTPRDCIGKNFAHMEMRAILCYLLQSYSFKLTEATEKCDRSKFLGVNYGTVAPQDLHRPEMIESVPGFGPAIRRPIGLRMIPVPRTN